MVTKNKLYRIENGDNTISGVCLGLSGYLNIDVSLIRATFILLFFFSPAPIAWIYFFMTILLPVKYD